MKRSFKDLASGRNFANNSSLIRLISTINNGHYSGAIISIVITENSIKLISSYFSEMTNMRLHYVNHFS